jgi:hypothetical protein
MPLCCDAPCVPFPLVLIVYLAQGPLAVTRTGDILCVCLLELSMLSPLCWMMSLQYQPEVTEVVTLSACLKYIC